MTGEQWQPVPGFQGHYEVSDQGRIRSVDRVIRTRAGVTKPARGLVLRPQRDSQGYQYVTVCVDGQRFTRFVHRLIAEAFHGPCPDGLEVRHLDGDNQNNVIGNLAYGTHRENELDKRAHGIHHNTAKSHCPRGHEYTPENTYVEPRRGTGRRCKVCRAIQRRAA